MSAAGKADRKDAWRALSLVGLGASALFLITALVLSAGAGEPLQQELPPAGGTVGPFEIEEPGTVVSVAVRQSVPIGAWSFVTGELLDANQEYLTGFGDEMWHETGQDSEGRWEDSETAYDVKLTLSEAAEYYFRFNVETNVQTSELSPIRVEIERRLASAVPHFAGGILLLIGSVIMNLMNGGILRRLMED